MGDLNILSVLLQAGIVVKAVLLALILASVYSWAIILKKNKILKNIEKQNKGYLQDLQGKTDFEELNSLCIRYPGSLFGPMYRETYDELLKIDQKVPLLKEHFARFGVDSLERAMKKAVNDNNILLDEKLSVLASVGSATPFIGLFGTVWGIINSFSGLSQGTASLEAVAPGIAEALVSTAVGLFAAIPAVLFFNKFSNHIQKLNTQMDSFSQVLLNITERYIVSKRSGGNP